MNKAIFFDRDGVINFEKGYTTSLEDFIILPYVREFLFQVQSKGYLIILISNQGGIAKGLFSMEEAEKMHTYLTEELSKKKIFLSKKSITVSTTPRAIQENVFAENLIP